MHRSPADFAQLVGMGQHKRRLPVPARADKPHVDPVARTTCEQPELIRTVYEHLSRDRSLERKRRPLATMWCHESEPDGTTNQNQVSDSYLRGFLPGILCVATGLGLAFRAAHAFSGGERLDLRVGVARRGVRRVVEVTGTDQDEGGERSEEDDERSDREDFVGA